MKRFTLSLIMVLSLLACFIAPASAQTNAQIVDTTVPVDSAVRDALDDWLAADPPEASVSYYAVTYTQADGLDTLVSLAGLDIGNPDDEWRLLENGVWTGTVRVAYNGQVSPLIPAQAYTPGVKVLASAAAQQGIAYVLFPFERGKGMVYGTNGVHSGAYTVPNGQAIDLVGGDDLGSNIAGPGVYASVNGEVDYVCTDGTSVAVRTYNSDTGAYFAYAHLEDNANLVLEHEFVQGAQMATLVYGSFDDNCGSASQQPNHYHLHWVFQPGETGERFFAEGCILNLDTEKWFCDENTIQPGGVLYHFQITWFDEDAVGQTQTSFFDEFLVGLISIFDRGVIKLLPAHTSPTMLVRILANGIVLVFRVAFVLVKGNFNLGPLMTMFVFAVGFKIIFSTVWLVLVVLRSIKSLVPAA